jgi:(methylthio)acryloyl-CoA hydratase
LALARSPGKGRPTKRRPATKPLVTYVLEDGIALIGLNRPEKRNAISDAVIEKLAAVVDRAGREAKAAIIHGAGNHFCAGVDLSEHVEKTPIEGVLGSRRWHEVFDDIQSGPIPFVAALHGAVVGGGLELAASAHIRVADGTAFFALPEGQRGIFVGGSGSVKVARLMGVARMTDLMLTGRVFSAEEGERYNLVQYLVEPGTALAKAKAIAGIAANNAALSNFAIINALPRIQDMARDDGLFVESIVASFTKTSPEAKERMRAFLDKRVARLVSPVKGG